VALLVQTIQCQHLLKFQDKMIYVIAKILEDHTTYDGIYSIQESNVDNIKVNERFRERS